MRSVLFKLKVIFSMYFILALIISHTSFSFCGLVSDFVLAAVVIIASEWLVNNWVFQGKDDGHG